MKSSSVIDKFPSNLFFPQKSMPKLYSARGSAQDTVKRIKRKRITSNDSSPHSHDQKSSQKHKSGKKQRRSPDDDMLFSRADLSL